MRGGCTGESRRGDDGRGGAGGDVSHGGDAAGAVKQWGPMALCALVFLAQSAVLKVTWYDHLTPGDGYLDATPAPGTPGVGSQRG